MMPAPRYSQDALYRRLLLQARPYWTHLSASFALGLLSIPLALLVPLPLKLVVDNVLGSQPLPWFVKGIVPRSDLTSPLSLLLIATALMVAIALVRQIQDTAATALSIYTGEKLLQDFRARLFRHIQRLSLSYHDTKGITDSTYRIQYDTYCVQALTLNGMIPMITSIIMLVGMVYVIARMDWQLALVALAVSPILFALSTLYREPLRRRWIEIKKLDSSAMSVIHEVLGAVRVVKSFGREEHEHGRFVRHSTERISRQVDATLIQGSFDFLIGITTAVGTAAALYVGVRHVRSGTLTLGALLVVMAYLAQLYSPLSTLSKLVTGLQAGLASAERAFLVFDELPEVTERLNAQPIVRCSGKLQFQRVSFSYDGKTPILNKISCEIPAGTCVGISGATGTGKTTLVSLLMRFYDPTEGQILLDGIDLQDYKLADLRNQFAMVLQDTVLFSASVAENIAYARPDATEHEIIEAAKLAEAHDFICRLPDGYQTAVGERGMRLSGGERQRISLARAFLKNAPILILDEPTSSVDTATETAIINAMERLMCGRTTLMIAHRLSTLDMCDARIEIEQGQIARAAGTIKHEATVMAQSREESKWSA